MSSRRPPSSSRRRVLSAVWLAASVGAGCLGGTPGPAGPDGQRPGDGGVDPDGPVTPDGSISLDPTPGTYRQTCDGSGAIALDFDHFLDLNDENQGARVYRRAASAAPVRELDVSAALGLAVGDEGDLEDVARIGSRLYIISSHGRNTSGQIRPARYRFGAVEMSGTAPQLALAPAGSTQTLLQAMLAAANWDAPDTAVIAALDASSKLGDNSDPDLAPELQGTNIEGLAARGAELLIGFRNPRPAGRAIVIRLANPGAVVTGQTPRFAGAATLDLGGLGIRGMAWSEAHGAVLVLAGPHDGSAGPFRIYKWSGVLGEAPVLAKTITAPAQSAPESIVPYPGTRDVQIVFDQGDALIGGTICKDVAAAERRFVDAITRVE